MARLVTTCTDPERGRSLVVSRAVAAGEVLFREDPFSLVYYDPNGKIGLDLSLAAELLISGQDMHPQITALHTNIGILSSEDKTDLALDSKVLLSQLDASTSLLGPTLPIRAMNILARVRVNALTIVGCCDGRRRGLGIYCAAAMMNHDCDPSAGVWFDGENESLLVVRALRPLEPGDVVTIAYVERSFPYLKRQSLLSRNFQFDCRCFRCVAESSHEPDKQVTLNSEAAELCTQGMNAYCSGRCEEALELMLQAEGALPEAPEHTTSCTQASESLSELRRQIWRYLANAAVAQRDFTTAESALASLAESNAALFPYHQHNENLPASSPHLDSALTEADLAHVRLAIIEEEEKHAPRVCAETLNRRVHRRKEATQLLQRAESAVELLCGKSSGLFTQMGR